MNEDKIAKTFELLGKTFTRISKVWFTPEKKTKEVDEPMTLTQFYDKCSTDKQRHIQLIADWAKIKEPDCKTKFQWRQFMKENMRDASDLSKFDDAQVKEGYKLLKEQKYERYNMRTLIKMITK